MIKKNSARDFVAAENWRMSQLELSELASIVQQTTSRIRPHPFAVLFGFSIGWVPFRRFL
jgi:hypothetical protein